MIKNIAIAIFSVCLLPIISVAKTRTTSSDPVIVAPIPLTPKANVQNFYSDTYPTPVTVSTWASNSNAAAQQLSVTGSNFIKYTFAANKDSIQTAAFGSLNVASYNFIHIDIYSTAITSFSLGFIDGDSVFHQYAIACANPTLNKWVSYDIPLGLYSSNGVDLNNLNSFLFIAGTTSNPSGTALYIDNIYFSTSQNFFSTSSGNLNLLSSWGTNSDGTNLGGIGNNIPTNFTSNNTYYFITNNSNATIGADWKVSGSNSKVVVGNGMSQVSFVVPSAFKFIDSCVAGYSVSPATGDVTVNVSVTPSTKGLTIPSTFTGLSWEASSTYSSLYFSTGFTKHINLIKNLGTGMLRIGANSADNLIWQNSNRGTSTSTDTIYKDQVDRYFGFVNAIGWPTIFGLNMGTGTVAQAINEAQYVSQNYGSNITSYEFGNEPDLFHDWCRASNWTVNNYITAFDSFYTSIKSVVPSLTVSGATGCCHVPDFGVPFVTSEHSKLIMETFHYYYSQAGAANATPNNLLSTDPTLASNTTTFVNQANSYSLPFRWSECNSLSSGGQSGISNALAAALWGTDFMYTVAKLGCSGVNFHSGGQNYSPIYYNGNVTPTPLYYGILAFSLGSKGTFIQNSSSIPSGSVNCNVYTILGNDGKYYITIVNKDMSKEAYIKITGLPINHSTQLIRLNGAYITDTSVNLGNYSSDSNGNWTNASSESAGSDATSYQLRVPKMSEVVMIVN